MKIKSLQKPIMVFIAIFALFTINSCGNFTLAKELGITSVFLSLSPSTATVAVDKTFNFTATGGIPPYIFSVSSGTGSIDPDTGLYSAPSDAGTEVVTVSDSSGVSDYVPVLIYNPGALLISPSSISLMTDGRLTFSATGGISPYKFSILIGSGTIGVDSGYYIATASPGVTTIRVSDSETPPNTSDASVIVTAAVGDPLSILPPSVTLSTNDTYTFVTIGGVPPYLYSTSAGFGIIDAITGEFHAPGTSSTGTITVTDSSVPTNMLDSSSVSVNEGLVILPQTISVPATNTVTFSASGGFSPYSYSMESGGGTLAGNVYTAPAATGSSQVRVTDDDGSYRIANITVTSPQPLKIYPSSFIIIAGEGLDFAAAGGTPIYSYLKVSGNGTISAAGAYTAPGTEGLDVLRVTDSKGITADAVVRVVRFGPLTISPTDITVEQNETHTFTATGGAPQYSYSVPGGAGSIESSTGTYTAANVPGTVDTIRVTDAASAFVETTVSVAPAAPTNLIAQGPVFDNGVIQLRWTNNASGEDGFAIEMKTTSTAYAEVTTYVGVTTDPPTIGPGVDTVLVEGLALNVPYVFRVKAYKGSHDSSWSNEAFDISNKN